VKGLTKDERRSGIEYGKLIRVKTGQEKRFLDKVKHGLVLGSDEFFRWVQKKFISRLSARDRELPLKTLVEDNGVVEKVLDEVARYFEVEKSRLLQRKRRLSLRARDVYMYFLREHSGLDNKRIGEVFGVSSSAVTKTALRISEQMKTQRRFKKETDQILYSVFNRLSENVVSWFSSLNHKKWGNTVAKEKFNDIIKLNESTPAKPHQAVQTFH